jgi:hypothetical protein
MQIRPTMIVVPLLATILVSQVVQAIGEPSSDARVTETTGTSDRTNPGSLANVPSK